MQPALDSPIQDASLAVFPVNAEKPHQGVASKNPALYLGHEVCNCTLFLGMRGRAELNRIGSCSTGKERDTESGNDYFGARYYASTMGRWLSPDWGGSSPVPYAVFTDPQSLNLYAYMRNNSLGGVDANGHCESGHFWCDLGMGALKYIYNSSQANALFLGRHGCMACAESAGVMNMGGQPTLNLQKPNNTAEAIGYYGVPVVSTALAVVPVLNETVAVTAALPVIETESITISAEIPEVSTTTLFRAVDSTELQSIQDTGQFLPSPNGTEYKGFFNTAEGAQSFSNLQSSSGGPSTTVVSGTAPTDLVNSSPVHQAAQEAPGVLIKNENLPQVKPQ